MKWGSRRRAPGRARNPRRPVRSSNVLLAGALAAGLLGGCTQETIQPPADLSLRTHTPVQALVTHVTPAWTAAIRPASRAVMLGASVLVHESPAPGRLELVSRAAADGREQWRTSVSQGTLPGGSQLTVSTASIDEAPVVALLTAEQPHRLVLADPVTGAHRSELALPAPGRLTSCPLVEGLCVQVAGAGRIPSGLSSNTLQLSPDGRRLDPLRIPVERGDAVTPLGERTYWVRRGNRTHIGVLEGGHPHWEKPVAEWFGTDVDPATHWFHARVHEGRLQLSVRPRPWAPGETSVGTGELLSAAIDLGDGARIWQRPGVSWACPGTTELLCGGPGLRITRDQPTGSAGHPTADQLIYSSPAEDTGEPRWRRDVRAPGPPRLGDTEVVPTRSGRLLGSRDQLVLLDPETGEPTTVGEEHWLACRSPQKFQAARDGSDGAPLVDFAVNTAVTCNGAGLAMAEPAQFTVAAILSAGARDEISPGRSDQPGAYAVVLPQGLAVYR